MNPTIFPRAAHPGGLKTGFSFPRAALGPSKDLSSVPPLYLQTTTLACNLNIQIEAVAKHRKDRNLGQNPTGNKDEARIVLKPSALRSL